MKGSSILLLAVLLALSACETTSPNRSSTRAADRQLTRDRVAQSAGKTSSTGTERKGPPNAQVMYQSTTSGAHARTTNSGVYQQRGSVTEEVHIGKQRLLPSQFPANYYRSNLQPGFVPSGTTGIYDPNTGRLIPVRR